MKTGCVISYLFVFLSRNLATVPPFERASLMAIYNQMNGPNWAVQNNWGVGDPCDDPQWQLVLCDGDTSVSGLLLSNNNLIGSLPSNLNLPNLSFL